MQGRAAAAEAQSQQAIAEYNAQVMRQQAKAEEAKAAYEARMVAEAGHRYESSLRAGLGASGAVVSAGTPLMIQARQAAETELEAAMAGYKGQVAARAARTQAQLDMAQASIYGQKASTASRMGMFGAGTTLLSGFGGLASRKWGF